MDVIKGNNNHHESLITRDLMEKLANVHRLINRRLLISNNQEEPHKSISRLQLNILSILYKKGAMSAGEISDYLMIRKPHMTVLKNKLLRRGYIKLEKHDNDHRVVKITITPEGIEIRKYFADLVYKNFQSKLSKLKRRDVKNLVNSVQKLSDINDKLE